MDGRLDKSQKGSGKCVLGTVGDWEAGGWCHSSSHTAVVGWGDKCEEWRGNGCFGRGSLVCGSHRFHRCAARPTPAPAKSPPATPARRGPVSHSPPSSAQMRLHRILQGVSMRRVRRCEATLGVEGWLPMCARPPWRVGCLGAAITGACKTACVRALSRCSRVCEHRSHRNSRTCARRERSCALVPVRFRVRKRS